MRLMSFDGALRIAAGDCALGQFLMAATEHGVCAIALGNDRTALTCALRKQCPDARIETTEGTLRNWAEAFAALLESPNGPFEVPLDPQGTPFQKKVWDALRSLPVGTTTTYAALAGRMGLAPTAARAVATACAANPIAVAIPCHRVVRSDGGLGGYRWGVERKRTLLVREGALAL